MLYSLSPTIVQRHTPTTLKNSTHTPTKFQAPISYCRHDNMELLVVMQWEQKPAARCALRTHSIGKIDNTITQSTISANKTDASESTDTEYPQQAKTKKSPRMLFSLPSQSMAQFSRGVANFELFREQNSLAYSTRDRSQEMRNRLCEKKFSFLEWIRPVQTVKDDEIVEFRGLDILMFLQFQRVGIKVALVVAMSAVMRCFAR
jgi:hypothetical protein